MNRAQRRAQAHRKPQRVLNKPVVWMAMHTMLQKHTVEDQDAQANVILITPAYTALDRLMAGKLTGQEFVKMYEIITYAYTLAERLARFAANPDTTDLLADCEKPLWDAAQALSVLDDRFKAHGKWVAASAEIAALREGFRLADELTTVAPCGHTLTALCDATELIQPLVKRPDLYS